MEILILHNKIVYHLFIHLKLVVGYYAAKKILLKLINELHKKIQFISSIYIIETAIFNILIPIKHVSKLLKKKYIIGHSLKKSIIYTIIKIFKFTKKLRSQSFYLKLTQIFIKLYNKEHLLYKQKISDLHKILTS